MCQRCTSCAWFIYGLTSGGSTDCGSERQPGIYTKISAFTTFINDVAKTVYDSLPPQDRNVDDLNIANGNFPSCS